eukprot:3588513-Alexandrium_andersonii.AAC.1
MASGSLPETVSGYFCTFQRLSALSSVFILPKSDWGHNKRAEGHQQEGRTKKGDSDLKVSANNRYLYLSDDEDDKNGKGKKNDMDDASDDSDSSMSSILAFGPDFGDPESERKRREVWRLAAIYDNLREFFQAAARAGPRWYV